jgi:uncharacterized NAD(P)/FAD-binding protein YdhS
VARRENYEILVLTWGPGQGSVAHDHSGSLCGLTVVSGELAEQAYVPGPDGQVRPATVSTLGPGQIAVDPGVIIHSLANPAISGSPTVTVHLYSPPLPEVRRFAVATKPPSPIFLREPRPDTSVIVIIGGGFTGTMTATNLLRNAGQLANPLRIVLIDRQPAVGDGIAYRTNDSRHVLNVPVEKMSAWQDRPGDFLDFARERDLSTKPGSFLPRKLYGQYIRQTFFDAAHSAPDSVSVEIVRDDAISLLPHPGLDKWDVATASGRAYHADVAVLALGHRPPIETFVRRWKGPRTRFVSDPWATLVLSQIGPDEPVLVLGSGLTAVDAILTLGDDDRRAPLIVVSRHGLLPQAHPVEPRAVDDISQLISLWTDSAGPLTARKLVRALRGHIQQAKLRGIDWRQVVDGLRPFTAGLWGRLSPAERRRFFTHVRPFWEIHRHRMAPAAASQIHRLRRRKIIDLIAGTLAAAEADAEGVNVVVTCRGSSATRLLRVAWVINCTGPGIHHRRSTHPILRPLIESGTLCDDELGLGLRTDAEGRAIRANGEVHSNLLVAGTLRKSALWESTAVPELRQQAAAAARLALATLSRGRSP